MPAHTPARPHARTPARPHARTLARTLARTHASTHATAQTCMPGRTGDDPAWTYAQMRPRRGARGGFARHRAPAGTAAPVSHAPLPAASLAVSARRRTQEGRGAALPSNSWLWSAGPATSQAMVARLGTRHKCGPRGARQQTTCALLSPHHREGSSSGLRLRGWRWTQPALSEMAAKVPRRRPSPGRGLGSTRRRAPLWTTLECACACACATSALISCVLASMYSCFVRAWRAHAPAPDTAECRAPRSEGGPLSLQTLARITG